LKPVKRKQHEIEIPEMGTLLHQVMDEFGKHLKDGPASIEALSEDDHLNRIAGRIVDDTLDQFNSGIFNSNARFNYLGQRLKRISLRAMKVMLFHLQNSGFQPRAFEMSFGRAEKGSDNAVFEIMTPDGTKVSLEGRIDRLDLLIDENTCYYRVIDYKSGKKHFSVTEVLYGLQLQLLLYLMAAMEQFDDTEVNNLIKKPAGLFYFYLDDPMIQMEKPNEANTASEIRKALKLNGLVLRDQTVIREMDRIFEKQSEIIPVGLTAAGELSKNSSVVTAEDLELLQTYVKSSIIGTATAILKGVIRAEPAQLDAWKACQYCDYQGICQYDEHFTGNLPRRLSKMKEKDALEKIRELVSETKGESK
jgi:ATP-dependent helicase/nuclease subunit B